jgi:hypothetical protein
MTRLAWTFVRSAGAGRALLLAASTALATALLLVALSMLLLPPAPAEALFDLVAQHGLRYGTALATAMLVLPLLLMLHQVVRLGTASRERRLAALRLAGATPTDVRRIGALEVGIPVTAGAVAGPLVFALLRLPLGGGNINPYTGAPFDSTYRGDELNPVVSTSPLALIPTSVTPAWWQIAAVVAVVAALGVLTGALASRHLIASPLGVSRRVRRASPRPWGLLLAGVGLGLFALALSGRFGRQTTLLGMAGGLLVLLGIITLAPWVAFRAGRRAARRTSDPAVLIAAGHLTSDPRPAGRAAAAVGAIGAVSGGAAVIEAGVFLSNSGSGGGGDAFYVASFVMVAVALLLVLLVMASTLSVHAAESLVDRRRVLAGLVAAGTPVSVLRDSLRQEAMLTSMPLSFGGSLIGAGVAALAGAAGGAVQAGPANPGLILAALLLISIQVAVTVALTRLAIGLAIRVIRARVLLATAPANLRAE